MGRIEMTYERVRRLFNYDPATGKMTRRMTTSSRAIVGMEVGCRNTLGYLVVNVDRKLYYVHRLIWLWMTGSWPEADIDHIDRKKSNNKWDNLRDVSRSANLHNRDIVSGVYWAARDAVWVATISHQGVRKHIGQHADRNVAEAMYAKAKQEYLPTT